MKFIDPKFAMAVIIVALFAWAYGENVGDQTMIGALIGAFNMAIGYYLGSSSSSGQIREQMGKVIDIAAASAPEPTKPDVTLQPGETAQAAPEKP